uniref:ATP-dependent rRNA helicase RRP3 n=1 Tax=Lygus hesperus TaxID=30085 RepID=A0A0A9WCK8_LYGHE
MSTDYNSNDNYVMINDPIPVSESSMVESTVHNAKSERNGKRVSLFSSCELPTKVTSSPLSFGTAPASPVLRSVSVAQQQMYSAPCLQLAVNQFDVFYPSRSDLKVII